MIDETKTVRLKDLRMLGKQGGATARLDNGSDVFIKDGYVSKIVKGYVDGILKDVELRFSYNKVYEDIRTIKKDGFLVARKVKTIEGYQLQLTGKGYHRTKSR